MTQNSEIQESQGLPEDQESSIDWIELLTVLWSSRKFIATVTGIATIVSFFVLPGEKNGMGEIFCPEAPFMCRER